MADNSPLNLMVVGPGSPHVINYLNLVASCVSEVVIVTPHPDKFPDHLTRCHIEFGLSNPLKWFSTLYAIRKLIVKHKPDVIHVHQANAYAFFSVLANRRFQTPLVLSVWGSDVLLTPQTHPWLKPLIRRSLVAANYLTAGSQTLAAAAQALVPNTPLKMKVCSFGVDPERAEHPKENIVYSNRNHRSLYRLDKVFKTFASFSASRPDEHWRLVVAGEGDLTDELRQLAHDLQLTDHVSFEGFVTPERNRELYAKARMFISMPISDSAAISLLEAMYHGCIPVLSALPAYDEWVVDGVNGVIDRGEPVNALERALRLDAQAVAEHNQQLIALNALRPIMAKAFCEVLQMAAAAKHSPA